MTEFLAFALIGLGPGAIYALAALGVVQIFRGSDTLNFAHGGMALVGATLMFQFWHKEELPLPLVLVLVLLTGVLLGVLSSISLWPLRASSATVRIIATTGILAVLQQGLLLIFGDSLGAQSVGLMPTYYPNGGWEITDGITIGYDRLILLALAVALTVAVRTFMVRTRFGMATVGASESPVAARALGFSPLLLSLGNWGIGGALATLTGALLVPLSGLTSGPIVLMVVPAFAAALIGGFRSYYLTLAGALGLGMAQALTTRYVGDVLPPEYATGWADAVPLIVIAVILTVRGTALTARGEHSVRMPRVGRVRPNPVVYVVLTLVGVVVALLASNELAPYITSGVLFAFIVLSLVVVVGLSGQLSFAQMALGGVGALICARLALEFDFGFLPALVIGTVAAGAVGAVFSIPVLRTRGPSLAIVTLGLALAVEHVVFANVNITGGFNGTPTEAAEAGRSLDLGGRAPAAVRRGRDRALRRDSLVHRVPGVREGRPAAVGGEEQRARSHRPWHQCPRRQDVRVRGGSHDLWTRRRPHRLPVRLGELHELPVRPEPVRSQRRRDRWHRLRPLSVLRDLPAAHRTVPRLCPERLHLVHPRLRHRLGAHPDHHSDPVPRRHVCAHLRLPAEADPAAPQGSRRTS